MNVARKSRYGTLAVISAAAKYLIRIWICFSGEVVEHIDVLSALTKMRIPREPDSALVVGI